MIALVRIALSRPYTFVVLALLLLIIGPLAALRTPTDIFPDIRIPVIGVVWNYTGLPPDQMAGPHHHAVPARADDHGQRHRTYRGELLQRHRHRQDLLPAECRHPHRQRAGHRDFADHAAADAAGHHAAADPQLQRLDRADPPARAVGRGPDRAAARSTSASTHSARRSSPCRAPRSRIRSAASSARSRSTSTRRRCSRAACPAQDVANALAAQNLITPAGTQKIGGFEYIIQLNNSPLGSRSSTTCRSRPSTARWSTSATSPACATAIAPQTNIVHVDGSRSVLMTVLKTGSASTLDIIDGIKQKLHRASRPAARRAQDRAASATSRCSSAARSAASRRRRASPPR